MALFDRNENDKFRYNRYAVHSKIVPKDGNEENTIDISEAISEVRILKDYDRQVFPYYRVTAAISTDKAAKIQEIWQDAKLYMTLIRFVGNENRSTSPSDETDTGDKYIEDVEFKIMVCDGAPANRANSQPNELSNSVQSVLFHMEILPVNAIGMNKKINSSAYHEITISELAASLTSDNAPEGDYHFYMSPTDNTKRYESIFVPSLQYTKALRYIDSVYGLYKGKLILFLDVTEGYILSSAKTVVRQNPEPKSVTLQFIKSELKSEDSSELGSCYEEGKRNFILRTSKRITAAFDGPAQNEVVGGVIKLVNNSFDSIIGSSLMDMLFGFMKASGAADAVKKNLSWQAFDNPLISNRLNVAAHERFSPAYLQFADCDLKAFNPLLEWELVAESDQSKSVEGSWRIQAMEAVLIKAPGTRETCSVDVSVIILPAATSE
jgi:hypothetical protein